MGLLLVDSVGAGPFAGLTIRANMLMSLAIEQFGPFGMEQQSLSNADVVAGTTLCNQPR